MAFSLCKLAILQGFPPVRQTARDRRQASNSLQARMHHRGLAQEEACCEACNGMPISANMKVDTS